MKGNLKMTALAVAVATFAVGTAAAQVAPPEVTTTVDTDITIFGDIEAVGEVAVGGELLVGGDVTLDYDYDYNDNLNRNVVVNDTTNTTVNETSNVTANETSTSEFNEFVTTDSSTLVVSETTEIVSSNVETNEVSSNIVRMEFGRTDVRGERDEHGVSVNIDKSLSLKSDITFTGAPTITGEIDLDSAAIALVDNRQSNTENTADNLMMTNEASIGDDVGTAASGNLQFNVAAGDHNVQDNAAALAAADAGFSFGLADAEIFVNQYGAGNDTANMGVTNSAGLGNNAFSDASGNIGANIASGHNNMQKNAMASSVATAAYSQATVSSNQVSTGNVVTNAGVMEEMTDTIDITLTGTVSGETTGTVTGTYQGTASGGYSGTGNSYQSSNFYADMWEGEEHPAGDPIGHADFDNESQGAVPNPFRDGVGGLGFDNVEEGDYDGTESGVLTFDELSFSDLQASLAGTVTTTQWIVRDATNKATLSDNAFANASGNIGVNLAAGSGNMQANSLAMAVAQPGANGAPPPTNGGGE